MTNAFRSASTSVRVAFVAVFAVIVGLSLQACGPSPLARGYEALILKVDPLMQREDVIWSQIHERMEELNDDADGSRYFPYLEGTALPFYMTLEAAVAEAEPVGGDEVRPLRTAWTALTSFAKERQTFVRFEIARRSQVAGAQALLALRDGQDNAAAAIVEYDEALADDVPDMRMGAMKSLIETFMQEQMLPAMRGEKDMMSPAENLAKVVLPTLERFRQGRFEDDNNSRLLRKAIVLNEESLRRVSDLMSPLLSMSRAIEASKAAAVQSEKSKDAFRSALAEARRDR